MDIRKSIQRIGYALFDSSGLTADRTFSFPNKNGALIVSSQLHLHSPRVINGLDILQIWRGSLPANSYATTAVIGTNNVNYSAQLTLKTASGTLLDTLTRTGSPYQVNGTGFTLANQTEVVAYLTTDNSAATGYLFSLFIE